MPVAEDWWFETLYRGYVFRSRIGLEEYFNDWHDWVATEILFDAYATHAKARGERRPIGREAFGAFLVRMGGRGTRPRNAVIGERIADVANIYGGTSRKAELVRSGRPYGYDLGNLQIARAAFERATGININWPPDDAPEI